MAILDTATWISATGVTPTGADLQSLGAITTAVSAAIVRMANGNAFERATYTMYLDAPWNSPRLQARQWPLVSVTSLHYNALGNGVSANYEDEHELEEGTDFLIDVDDDANNWSKRGWLRRLRQDFWGVQYTRSLSMPLTNRPQTVPKAVKLVAVCGYAVLPDDLVQAAVMAATLMYTRRKTGLPVTNEAWNGYSYGTAGPFTATAALTSPDVWHFLRPYVNQLAWA